MQQLKNSRETIHPQASAAGRHLHSLVSMYAIFMMRSRVRKPHMEQLDSFKNNAQTRTRMRTRKHIHTHTHAYTMHGSAPTRLRSYTFVRGIPAQRTSSAATVRYESSTESAQRRLVESDRSARVITKLHNRLGNLAQPMPTQPSQPSSTTHSLIEHRSVQRLAQHSPHSPAQPSPASRMHWKKRILLTEKRILCAVQNKHWEMETRTLWTGNNVDWNTIPVYWENEYW